MALRRIVGAYRTTPIAVLQKEAGIMPYSIRLKFMVARKAIRLHLNISKTNPINGHLLTLIEKSPIAKLTTLYMLAKDDRDYMIKIDEKRKCKRVEPLTLKQQQNQTIGILKKQAMEEWQEMYWNSSKDLWYHNITVESKCTDNLSKMVTGVIMKKDSRRILSNITQFRTGHGNFGAWFKKFGIEKDSYNCKCGELETVHHILVECPLLEEERKGLKRISPEMDMSTLLNSLTGLQEIKEVKLLGITLNNLLDFKSHILNKINKARKAVGAIWHLGGVQKGMRGSAVRSLYIACVRPIVEYGLEIWHHKILKGEIHKLEVMQNMALRRIVGAYRTTPIAVLQKEAGIMPYSIRLKFMVARKAIRLHLNISKTNPINGHLLTLIEKSPIAKLTTLYMLAKDDRDYMIKKDEKRKCKRVEPLTLKQQQNQTIGILKKQAMEEWQEMYWNSSKDLWYHNITVESKCTDNLSKMVTGVIMKKDSRRILSNITQFRTGHGNFGAWFKKFGIEKDSYNCKCGELETVHHILVECPLLEEERKGLKRISPEMDMSTLLNSLTGLQEIVSFISAWRD
ncbi:uncharacterized protein SAPINGB_P006483 [Magnusiomyces paraingens]|uniref:Uncharacterized protein n=2 Tax=Magnusiomyces paraingens TaxID=2606893 RepID=A0A5E8C7V4_9ASCO|nr:uncharacterized protein SAPINGB_P006483 [Saprochaete ingens]VVT58985.1 unnamed protein product [Saprochaete ingens]